MFPWFEFGSKSDSSEFYTVKVCAVSDEKLIAKNANKICQVSKLQVNVILY